MRQPVVRYLASLQFSINSAGAFRNLLKHIPKYDDLTKLLVVKGIVNHAVPRTAARLRLIQSATKLVGKPASPFDWYARFQFLAKYGEPYEVLSAVEQARSSFRRDSFLARQAMAVIARASGINWDRVRRILSQEVSRGATDSASVAVSVLAIMENGFPSKGSRLYYHLFPKNLRSPYPLSKFLILCVLAATEARGGKPIPRPEVGQFVNEPWMRRSLMTLNAAWLS